MPPRVGIRDWGFVNRSGQAHASADPDCIRDRPAIGILTNKRTADGAGRAVANPDSPILAPMR